MKKDIGFVEYMDEASATVAKEALHNYKLDGENKIKVQHAPMLFVSSYFSTFMMQITFARK
jgi:RNA recognition motif. (a.k.a. RRM, RBD, or RNP domain)